jgi:hypothetical protein
VIDTPEDEEIMEPSEGYAPDDLVSDHSEDQDDDTSYDEGADAEEEVGNYADFINMNDVQQLADAVLRDEESNRDEELSVDEEPSVEEAAVNFDIDEDEHPFAEIEDLDSEEAEDTQDEDSQPDEEDDFFGEVFDGDKQTAQGELELDGGPKGKFEGESPNVLEGEDLDIPPFLRNKKK